MNWGKITGMFLWGVMLFITNCCIGIPPYDYPKYSIWFSFAIKNESSYNFDLFFNDININNLKSNTTIEYLITLKQYRKEKYNVVFNVNRDTTITQFPDNAKEKIPYVKKDTIEKNIMELSYLINGKISTIRIPLYPVYEEKEERRDEKYLKIKAVTNDSISLVFTKTIVVPLIKYPYPEQYDTLTIYDSSFTKP